MYNLDKVELGFFKELSYQLALNRTVFGMSMCLDHTNVDEKPNDL